LGELYSVPAVVYARYDNTADAHLDIIEPEINVQLRAYVQREHHLYETPGEGEIRGFRAKRPGIPRLM
jgi:hypothetical protein